MADTREDLTEPTDPLRRGLRPAASQDMASRRTLDIAVVAAGGMGCVLIAGFFGVLSMDAAVLMAAAIAAFATAWLRLAPRASVAARRPAPMSRPVVARSEFPLTPETGVAIIERLPDPIILLDRSGRIILHNRAATNIVGQGAARRHISTVMRVPQVLEAVAHVVDGEAAQVVEYMQPVPIERHYHAFIAPVMAAASDTSKESRHNVLILLHDLTTLKRAEQMRADFVANASHELRTPLASMSGFVETLQGPARDDPDARDKFLGIMQEQAERMGRLINDLLSLSRIELNEHVRPSSPVDLASIIRDTADMLSPLAEKEGVTISLDIEEDVPHPLGDRDELVQVCQNLLSNAFKYGGSGGKVDVSLHRDRPPGSETGEDALSKEARATEDARAGSIVMTVRDYGHGIEREHLPRLTERFYRVNVEQSRRRGGTGLGLAIVKHIVNRHMGSLSIDSEVGAGSAFKVFLPVDQKAVQAAVVARSPANVTGPVT